jgi:hypothetical protein
VAFPVNQDHAGKQVTRKPQPADLFRHAQPWRFASRGDGRKYRVVRERLRRLARVLARFDRSGNCREIFPAVATITAQLNAAELNYPDGQRFKWSRPTVFRYLDRLKRGGVATSSGLSHYHGTRRRVLHSDRLLSVPPESETPTPANLRQELNPRSLKFHKTRKKRPEMPTAAETAACGASLSVKSSALGKRATPLPYVTAAELRQPARAIQFLNLIADRYQAQIPLSPAVMLAWVLRKTKRDPDCGRHIFHPPEYVIRCVENFLCAYPDYQQTAILERFEGLPGVEFYSGRWMTTRHALEARIEANWREPNDQDREKIGFVRMIVEEAARRGVPASELLAERLEAEKPSCPEAPRRAQSEADGPQHRAESPDAGCIKSAAPQSPTPDAWMDKYKRAICPDCGVSVLHWTLEDGLHRKVCPGPATSPT